MAMSEPNDNLYDTIDRLTQRERECLRLVAQLMTSKQIALQLGISKHTVDERIESARRRLGARGRFEAARLLAAYEGGARFPPIESGPDSIGLVDSADEGTLDPTSRDEGNVAAATLNAGRPDGRGTEDRPTSAEGATVEGRIPPTSFWPIDRSQMGLSARLGAVLLMAVLSALAFGGILSGLDALKRLH